MRLYAPPRQAADPDAAEVNPDHLVCGLAASLGHWRPDQFGEFLTWFGRGGRVRLRVDHVRYQITTGGARDAIGRCLRFASVPPRGSFPGGLLCLAEVYPDWAEGILAGMRTRDEWLAMSVGGAEDGWVDGGPGDLLIREVSLVDKVGNQADPEALVVGYGPAAVTRWELLAGEQVPDG